MERWIEEGRLQVDGVTAQLGDRVFPDQKVLLDGKAVELDAAQQVRVLLYHKPVG